MERLRWPCREIALALGAMVGAVAGGRRITIANENGYRRAAPHSGASCCAWDPAEAIDRCSSLRLRLAREGGLCAQGRRRRDCRSEAQGGRAGAYRARARWASPGQRRRQRDLRRATNGHDQINGYDERRRRPRNQRLAARRTAIAPWRCPYEVERRAINAANAIVGRPVHLARPCVVERPRVRLLRRRQLRDSAAPACWRPSLRARSWTGASPAAGSGSPVYSKPRPHLRGDRGPRWDTVGEQRGTGPKWRCRDAIPRWLRRSPSAGALRRLA